MIRICIYVIFYFLIGNKLYAGCSEPSLSCKFVKKYLLIKNEKIEKKEIVPIKCKTTLKNIETNEIVELDLEVCPKNSKDFYGAYTNGACGDRPKNEKIKIWPIFIIWPNGDCVPNAEKLYYSKLYDLMKKNF